MTKTTETIPAGGCPQCGVFALAGVAHLCQHGVATGPTMDIVIETETPEDAEA